MDMLFKNVRSSISHKNCGNVSKRSLIYNPISLNTNITKTKLFHKMK